MSETTNIARCGQLQELNAPSVNDGQIGDELIKAMALAVGKNLAAYVEVMYPEAMEAASSTFKTSLRNHVYNDIMHVSTLHTAAEIRAWLSRNDAYRKQWVAAHRKIRGGRS